jgi:hypothetical protein
VARAEPRRAPEPIEIEAPSQPLLRTATFVRPKPQRLAPEASAVTHVAYQPTPRSALGSLLPADIADIAAAERGKGRHAKADR